MSAQRVLGIGLLAVLASAAVLIGILRTIAPPEEAAAVAEAPAPDSGARQGQATMPAGHPPTGFTDFTQFQVGQRNVKDLMVEGDVLYVGTSGGVIRYDLEKRGYRVFNVDNGLLANGVFSLGRVNGRLAVGTYGGGLALQRPDDSWQIFNIPEGLADAFVYDTLTLDNGDVWIATWSGANRVRGGAMDDPDQWDMFTVHNTEGGLPNDWVYGLEKGADGSVWMATEGGLAHFHDGQWRNWNHEDGLGAPFEVVAEATSASGTDPGAFSRHHAQQKEEMGLEGIQAPYNPNYIVALQVADDGTVWAGTWGGGLARFKDGQWTNYTTADGLPGNHVFSLFRDRSERLWVGTNRGLALMRPNGGFRVFTTADGLYANNVFAMTQGGDGAFWVGSFGGVAHLKGM